MRAYLSRMRWWHRVVAICAIIGLPVVSFAIPVLVEIGGQIKFPSSIIVAGNTVLTAARRSHYGLSMTTDIDGASLGVRYGSTNAFPQAVSGTNRTGSSTMLTGGIGSRFITVSAFASVTGDAITIRTYNSSSLSGTAPAPTTTTLTEGVDWTAQTSNTVTAASLAAAINTALSATGVSATNVAGVVYVTPSVNNAALDLATTDAVNLAITQGANGNIYIGINTGTTGSGQSVYIGAAGNSVTLNGNFTGRVGDTGTVAFGSSSSTDALFTAAAGLLTIDQSNDNKIFLSVNGTANVRKALTLGVGAVTFAPTNNVMTITGDGGGNTIGTITVTSATNSDGMVLTLIFVDALVTITSVNFATRTANQITLSGAFVSTGGDVLTLVRDATGWVESARSINP